MPKPKPPYPAEFRQQIIEFFAAASGVQATLEWLQ